MYKCTKIFHINYTKQPQAGDLEDRQDVRRRSNSTRYVDRFADDKELIPSRLLAMLAQRFKVEELANRHSPASEHDLVT